ncbi:DUF2397 family protein [Candidatus Sumerlaeota bacterium]|nr:DUF2397 family protein [Candidatus Sumerlaeota bacterium]
MAPPEPTSSNPLESLPSAARRGLFRFLVADQPEAYWAILGWLARRRHLGELEVDLEALREAVPMERDLMAALRQLEDWGNLTTRIEPRKIRTLEDRRVERYRVSLGEETDEILEFAAQELDREEMAAELAEDLLRSLDAGLGRLLELLRDATVEDDSAVLRDGSSLLRQLRREMLKADKELIAFARSIRMQARSVRPSGTDVAGFSDLLQRYVAQYLTALDEVRGQALKRLETLQSEEMTAAQVRLQSFLMAQAEEAMQLAGRRARVLSVDEVLLALRRFFEPGGELHRRCEEIQSATIELVGSLRRYLEELLTRSQRRALLKSALDALLQSPEDESAEAADRLFDQLWRVVRPHTLEGTATPQDRENVELPDPGPRRTKKELSAFVAPPKRPRGVTRSLAEQELKDLNEFVDRAILKGAGEAWLTDGIYAGPEDARLLYRAIRAGRDRRNPMARRLLRFRVEVRSAAEAHWLKVDLSGGCLTAPPLLFVSEAHHGG